MPLFSSIRLHFIKFKNTIIGFFYETPAILFLLFLLIWVMAMYFGNKSLEDIWGNANGVGYDLLIFGLVLSLYEFISAKKEGKRRNQEEIDNYRGWNEKEATYRIVGSVRRLNDLKFYKINLKFCFLQRANLWKAKLQGADLRGADLIGANLREADLQGASLQMILLQHLPSTWGAVDCPNYWNIDDIQGAILKGENAKDNESSFNYRVTDLSQADLRGADLRGADLSGANLSRAYLQGAKFNEATLCGAELQSAKLEEANFEGANLQRANLEGANLVGASFQRADLRGVKLHLAEVERTWFEKLVQWEAQGIEEITKKYGIDEMSDNDTNIYYFLHQFA